MVYKIGAEHAARFDAGDLAVSTPVPAFNSRESCHASQYFHNLLEACPTNCKQRAEIRASKPNTTYQGIVLANDTM
eukprot:929131-Amphidinium_carterae.1